MFVMPALLSNTIILDLSMERYLSCDAVETFFYLGDVLSSDVGYDHAVFMLVNRTWKKFRELNSFLFAKRIGLDVECEV